VNSEPATRDSADGAPIGIVILAAGASIRMGTPKQLLSFRGSSLLRHTAETALLCDAGFVTVVLGANAEQIRPELAGLPVGIVENADWPAGMGSSLRAGLQSLLAAHPEAAAAIFLVCDQPLLSAETLDALINPYRGSDCPIAASAYGDTLGVPALFDRSIFPELLALQGAQGAKHLIRAHRDQVVGVPFPDGSIDVDTPRDYQELSSYLCDSTISIPS
jgi:molybdenum cofactor cytidylyltransferase